MWPGTSRLAPRPTAPDPGLMGRMLERQSRVGEEGSEPGRKGVEVVGFSRGELKVCCHGNSERESREKQRRAELDPCWWGWQCGPKPSARAHAHTDCRARGVSRALASYSFLSFLSYTHKHLHTNTPSAALPEQSHEPPLSTFTSYTHNNSESLHSISFIQLSFMPEKVKPTGTSALLDLTKHIHRPTATLRARGTRLTPQTFSRFIPLSCLLV